jgi:hypothetical protein
MNAEPARVPAGIGNDPSIHSPVRKIRPIDPEIERRADQ